MKKSLERTFYDEKQDDLVSSVPCEVLISADQGILIMLSAAILISSLLFVALASIRAQASHNTAAVAAWQVWRCTLTYCQGVSSILICSCAAGTMRCSTGSMRMVPGQIGKFGRLPYLRSCSDLHVSRTIGCLCVQCSLWSLAHLVGSKARDQQ